jgi:hypothetical protein
MVNLIIPIKFINVVCKLACSGLFRIFARKAKKTLKGCRRFAAHRLNLNCCELELVLAEDATMLSLFMSIAGGATGLQTDPSLIRESILSNFM